MQSAIDATALMLSKNIATLTPAQMNTQATNYFNALFTRTDVTGIQITPTYTSAGGSQIVLNAQGTVPTTFLQVLGKGSVNINVSSTVKWGNKRLRIALALDNTGSMADSGKMTRSRPRPRTFSLNCRPPPLKMVTCTYRSFRSRRMSISTP